MSITLIQWIYAKYRAVGFDHDPAVRGTAEELGATVYEVAAVVGKYGC